MRLVRGLEVCQSWRRQAVVPEKEEDKCLVRLPAAARAEKVGLELRLEVGLKVKLEVDVEVYWVVGIEVKQKAELMVEIVVGLEVCWWWD